MTRGRERQDAFDARRRSRARSPSSTSDYARSTLTAGGWARETKAPRRRQLVRWLGPSRADPETVSRLSRISTNHARLPDCDRQDSHLPHPVRRRCNGFDHTEQSDRRVVTRRCAYCQAMTNVCSKIGRFQAARKPDHERPSHGHCKLSRILARKDRHSTDKKHRPAISEFRSA